MVKAMTQLSVVIPVFNGATTVGKAIDSALNQTFEGDFEVVVVNDGSTDTTAEVLKQYEGRIRVLNQVNRGPAAARNAAVAQSSAEYIAFLDADDTFMTNKLARAVPLLANNRRAT